jgi:hypothetical protein
MLPSKPNLEVCQWAVPSKDLQENCKPEAGHMKYPYSPVLPPEKDTGYEKNNPTKMDENYKIRQYPVKHPYQAALYLSLSMEKPIQINPDQFCCCRPALAHRDIKNNVVVHRSNQPAIYHKLILELSSSQSCIPKGE